MLATILADEINVVYQDLEDVVVVKVNGKNVSELKDLVKAVEENKGRFHVFVDVMGKQFILDKEKMEKRSKIILEKYKVGSDRSEDLKK